jgi:hypothetical protein
MEQTSLYFSSGICWFGVFSDNHNPANISVEWSLRKASAFSCTRLLTVYVIVIFINKYKCIKVHRQSNTGDCREL